MSVYMCVTASSKELILAGGGAGDEFPASKMCFHMACNLTLQINQVLLLAGGEGETLSCAIGAVILHYSSAQTDASSLLVIAFQPVVPDEVDLVEECRMSHEHIPL
ncbi:hypothetical protein HELRODRAFT_163961 [Helobdella robusta]|uniref:Uncharacterized protein n=1 Tax=Helobdella robusta TaxID=6412 RepID=T1EUP1_HELRO|nr:hypothetical protein HELRODRAFT_163961 [Helobdella robusta]ESN94175.1 hypothetical protein HELRODRAFT_163961 [Helobdella robusta]